MTLLTMHIWERPQQKSLGYVILIISRPKCPRLLLSSLSPTLTSSAHSWAHGCHLGDGQVITTSMDHAVTKLAASCCFTHRLLFSMGSCYFRFAQPHCVPDLFMLHSPACQLLQLGMDRKDRQEDEEDTGRILGRTASLLEHCHRWWGR